MCTECIYVEKKRSIFSILSNTDVERRIVNIRISSFFFYSSDFFSIFHFFQRDLAHSYTEMKERTLDEYQRFSLFTISLEINRFTASDKHFTMRIVKLTIQNAE